MRGNCRGIQSKIMTKTTLLYVMIMLMIPSLAVFGQEASEEEFINTQMESFYQHRRKNVEEAKDILDALYQQFPNNALVISRKIEFEVTILGKFEDAIDLVNEKKDIIDGSEYSDMVNYYIEDLFVNDFKPLILKIKDKRIIESAYIPNIEIEITFPSDEFINQLTPIQRARFKYIRSPEFSTAKRFHFVSENEETEDRVIQIEFFPVSEVSAKYKLLIDKQRRYPFEFSRNRLDTVSIFWHSDWRIREWIPDNRIVLTYSTDYTLSRDGEPLMSIDLGSDALKSELLLDEDIVELKMEPTGARKMLLKTLKISTLSILILTIFTSVMLSTGGV